LRRQVTRVLHLDRGCATRDFHIQPDRRYGKGATRGFGAKKKSRQYGGTAQYRHRDLQFRTVTVTVSM
jgi:hypothetical protein